MFFSITESSFYSFKHLATTSPLHSLENHFSKLQVCPLRLRPQFVQHGVLPLGLARGLRRVHHVQLREEELPALVAALNRLAKLSEVKIRPR